MDPDCLFCKIATKQIPAKIIYEDQHALAFSDAMPRAEGHTLVIPKIHAANMIALPDEEIAPLFAAVKSVDKILAETIRPDGMSIGINQGRAGGQEVDHLHIHLIPRSKNDAGGSIQSIVGNKRNA